MIFLKLDMGFLKESQYNNTSPFSKKRRRTSPFRELLEKNSKFKLKCSNPKGFENPSTNKKDFNDKSFIRFVIDKRLAFPCIFNLPNLSEPFRNDKELMYCLRHKNQVALMTTPGNYRFVTNLDEIVQLEDLWSKYFLLKGVQTLSSTDRYWFEYFEFLDNKFGPKSVERLLARKKQNIYKAESQLVTEKHKPKAPPKNLSWFLVGFFGFFGIYAQLFGISSHKNFSWMAPPPALAAGDQVPGSSGSRSLPSSRPDDRALSPESLSPRPEFWPSSRPSYNANSQKKTNRTNLPVRKLKLNLKTKKPPKETFASLSLSHKDFDKTQITSNYLVILPSDLPYLLVHQNINRISLGFSFDENTILPQYQLNLVKNLYNLKNQFYKIDFHRQDPFIDMKDLTPSQNLQLKQVERKEVSFHVNFDHKNIDAGPLTSVTLTPCFAINKASLGLIIICSIFIGAVTSTMLQNKMKESEEKTKKSEEKTKESEEKTKESEDI